MKTAELLVEPLLIGYSVLVLAALLASPDLEKWLLSVSLDKVATAAAFAYFVGVIFDRVADTILGPLNHHHRLQFALDEITDDRAPAGDPFPEEAYHIRTMQSEWAWEHTSYLRSRIRLLRALVVLTPALGIAVAVRLSEPGTVVRFVAVLIVLVTYLVIGINAGNRPPRIRTERLGKPGRFDPPRTEDLSDPRVIEWYTNRFPVKKDIGPFFLHHEPAAWVFLFLAGVAGAVALISGKRLIGLVLPPAVVMAMFVLSWSWWRISETFFTFLRDYYKFAPVKDPSKTEKSSS
jgi:hypothetical protein